MTTNFKHSALGTAITLALAACGGGGGSSTDSAAPGATASLTLTGTAATGQAIANAVVEAKCHIGTGTGVTKVDGSYSIDIAGGSLPCVLEVRPAAGATLHAVAEGSGTGTATVNVTPLTELVAAHATRGAPADLFASFDAAAQSKVNAAAVNAAMATLVAALQGIVDVTGLNPMRDALVAANGAVAGNAHDQKLDALKAALAAAQTTLAELTAAVAANAASSAAIRTVVQPATASCAGLRSGKYRVLNPHEVGFDATHVAHLISVDAARLSATDDADATRTPLALTAVSGSACKFTAPSTHGTQTVYATRSGLAIALAPSSTGQLRTSLIVPEQALPVAELAGNWNFLEFSRDTTSSAFAQDAGTATIDAAGQLTGGSVCVGLNTCSAFTGALESFTVNAAGGFDLGTARAFAFKTPSGKVSLFLIDRGTGSVTVLTKQAPLALPAVGLVQKFWDFTIASNGVPSVPTDFTTTIKSVDSAAQTFSRERLSDGRIDSFENNRPREGLRHRPAGTSATTSGASVSYSELVSMSLPDTGLTVYGLTATPTFFGVSVTRP